MSDEPQQTQRQEGMAAPGTNAWQLDITTRLARMEARLAEIYALLQRVAGKPLA